MMHNPSTALQGLACILILFQGCRNAPTPPPLFELLDKAHTGIGFQNDLEVQVDLNIFNYMYFYNGAGTAAADLNNDGLIDLLFTANLGRERLYLNKGNLQFEDVSDRTAIDGGPNGFTTGVSIADINGDGLNDIYLCQVGAYRQLDNHNKLFICTHIDDNGIPHYREAATEYGVAFKGFSTMAGFFDYDLDGDLDLFLMNHSLHHNGTFGRRVDFLGTIDTLCGDRLYRNDGERFTDVTRQAGIHSMVIGYGLGLSFSDINLDGYPDIYVGNDFHENDYLYINNGDGTFTESASQYLSHTSKFSMGTDIADINNDMAPDIISLDMLPADPYILKTSEGEDALDIFNFKIKYGYQHQYSRNCLHLNNGNGTFSEIGRYANVHATDWSWTPLLFDMDLDGQRDLFVSNGIPRRMNDIDYINFISGNDIQYKIQFDRVDTADLSAIEKIPQIKIKNRFFTGTPSLEFQDAASRIKNDRVSFSNSAVYADFDLDGDLDIAVNNINDPAFLYKNLAADRGAKAIRIALEGPAHNRAALGSKVAVWQGGSAQYAEKWQVRGFQSSMLDDILIAQTAEQVDSLWVVWPDGSFQVVYKPSTPIALRWAPGLPKADFARFQKRFAFAIERQEQHLGLLYEHRENPFVEFDREKLIPHSTSTDGPALATGDLNGDGTEDIFVGSSKFEHPALFLSQPNGRYQRSTLDIDSTFEEVDAVIADFDGDGHADLLIATGGNEFRLGSPYTRPLLFAGDGKGRLAPVPNAFPADLFLTAASATLCDINGDALPDLFLGARAVPWSYGAIPRSYALLNKGNLQFEDVTRAVLPAEGLLGMVRNSCAADLNADGRQEILLALEWGSIQYLQWAGDHFKLHTPLSAKGWWTNIAAADLNADGLPDIIATNQGLNNRLKPDQLGPVKLYHADFDDNGTAEQLLTWVNGGQRSVFHNIHELQGQLPVLKKTFLRASDFARSDYRTWFPPKKYGQVLEAETFRTVVLLSDGSGGFQSASLPPEVQMHHLQAIHVADMDADGFPDILLLGNYHDANIQLGRYDSCFGLLLKNKGKEGFTAHVPGGEVFKGQVRRLAVAGPVLLAAVNDGPLRAFTLRYAP